MGDLQGARGVGGDARGLARGERPVVADDGREVLALDELHDDVRPRGVLAEVEHLDDVGVAQRGGRTGLVAEPGEEVGVLAELGPQQLDGDVPLELRVARPVDRRHAALPEELKEAVTTPERGPDLGHGVLVLLCRAPCAGRILPYAVGRATGSGRGQMSSERRYSRNSGPVSGRASASSTDAWSQPIVVPAS